MAVSDKAIKFLGDNLDRGRPIPGQSLTNEPDQPYNWEKPSEFTNPREAMLYVFETLTVPETVENVLLSVMNGVSVIDIASITLYSGFLEGKWNPDLMTLLMEPTMYMIMALAEKAEIPFQLDAGDDVSPQTMSGSKQVETLDKSINQLDELKRQAVNRASPMSVPQDIREIIKETKIEKSLLEKVKDKPTTSLLNKEV